MQPTSIINMQAEMAYRTTHLTEEFHRAGTRHHRGTSALRSRLHWRPRSTKAE